MMQSTIQSSSQQASRRRFLKVSAGLVVGCAWAERLPKAAEVEAGEKATARKTPAKKIPVGLQLYAVRGAFSRDVPGTLESVRKVGYRGVEFWGYGGTPKVYQDYDAKQLRRLLDQNSLRCCGMHLQLQALDRKNLERTIENNRILGNKFLIVAAAKEKMGSESSIEELAAFLTETAARCKKDGMRVGYHAHGFDFAKVGGRFAWDRLFSRAGPEVVMQMDVGNCLGGGGDPIAMLKKFPGRATTLHIKEHEEKTFDSDYYREVFRLAETVHRTEWYIVEMGDAGGNGLEIPVEAFRKLHGLGKC